MSSLALFAILLAAVSSMVVTFLVIFTLGRRFIPLGGAPGAVLEEATSRGEGAQVGPPESAPARR